MAGDYNLGTATGRIVVEYDNKGVTAAKRDLDGLGKKGQDTGKNVKAGMAKVGNAAGLISAGAIAGLGVMIGVTARFDKAMSDVQAATHETAKNMDLLRNAAINAGAQTVFSASEAAHGIEELAKAGVSTKDILSGGLTGALNLASAGALSVADSAEIAASAMVQFGLSGKDIPHIADLLAAGAGKAQGSVADLGVALKYAGVPANALGVNIEETTGVLAEFASTGIVGSQAGTTLRSMLLSLAAPTNRAKKTMDDLGISMYDGTGKFVGLQGAAEQLKARLGPLTEAERNHALSVIFGQTAIQGAITLYKGGGQAVQDWTKKVNDSGYATDTAAARMNNLSGDVEQLKGSLETAFIKMGESSQGPLRLVTESLTNLVNGFSSLPGPVHEGLGVILLLIASASGLLFAFVKVSAGVTAVKTALTQLGVSAATTSRIMSTARSATIGLGLAFIGLEAGLTIVDKINKSFIDALPGVQELTGKLITLQQTGKGNLGAQFDDLGRSIDRVTHGKPQDKLAAIFNAVLPNDSRDRDLIKATDQIDALDKALTNLVSTGGPDTARKAFDQMAKSMGLTGDQTDELLKRLPGYKEALAGAANEAAVGAGATDQYGNAIAGAAAEASPAAQEIEGLTKAMQDQVKAALGAFDAETQYRQALKDAAAQAKASNDGIKGSSDAALKNRQALSGLAAAWNNQSDEVKNNVARQKDARAAFIQTARDMGVPIGQARRLANTLLEIPTSKIIRTTLAGADAALAAISRIKNEMASIKDKTVRLTYYVNQVNATNKRAQGGVDGDPSTPRAHGGLVRGPGTHTSDSIRALLSDYEYVQRASAVRYYGVDFMNAINNLKIPKDALPGFAGGGLVDQSMFGSLLRANSGADSPVVVLAAPTSTRSDASGALTQIKQGDSITIVNPRPERASKSLTRINRDRTFDKGWN